MNETGSLEQPEDNYLGWSIDPYWASVNRSISRGLQEITAIATSFLNILFNKYHKPRTDKPPTKTSQYHSILAA